MKISKIYYLFLLPPLTGSPDRGLLQNPPLPTILTEGKIFWFFFHRYMSIWTKGG